MAMTRDRWIVGASLAAATVLAWIHLLGLSQGMAGMDMPGMAMPSAPASFPLTAGMWAVMMVGMMLPSAMPMILLFSRVQWRQGKHPLLTTGSFAAGYLLIWGGFAVTAAGLQIAFGALALLSPSLSFVSARLAGAAFLLAAAYEFSPLKNRCLTQCSHPVGFITSRWQPGVRGALRMGGWHGAVCVGCCWALMGLLFAVGVMNLLWVAVLTVLVLLQKILPYPRMAARLTGTALAAAGLVIALG